MKAKPRRLTKAEKSILATVRVPPISVGVKTEGREDHLYCDALSRVRVRSDGHTVNFDLANKLRDLADFFANTDDDYKGNVDVYFLRRRSRP